ncbi:MAG: LptF/LptG family permease [Xanthobacteraceae bacterium]
MELPFFIELADHAGLTAAGYKLQYQKLLSRPALLVAMVLVAAAFSLGFFRFGGVQKMVLCGIAAGFFLYVLSKVADDLSKAELLHPIAAAWLPIVIGHLHGSHTPALPGGRLMVGRAALLRRSLRRWLRAGVAVAAIVAAVASVDIEPVQAQSLNFRSQLRPTPPPRARRRAAEMLLQATEIQYDYPNERVSAVGNVQVYYKGTTVEADKVIYDQRTKHLHAEGNADHRAGRADHLWRVDRPERRPGNGFIDLLRIETIDQTVSPPPAESAQKAISPFSKARLHGLPALPRGPAQLPLWQVKAARIIHDQSEKMVYFEDAKLEFFGVPLLYTPYLAAPDPTVKRKSGFLMPLFTTSSLYGFSVQTPYYLALAPNYDT